MSTSAEAFPVPINPASRRLESVDLLRGLLMLLMAIDHARDYFSSVAGINPTDPVHSWPALFATRWITHLCAPGFIALAGTSVYLQRQRGRSRAQMARLLYTRGIWLVFLEVTVISFAWSFAPAPALQVIWAVGVSMIFLGTLQRLPVAAIGAIGAAIVLLHNLLDPISAESLGREAALWNLVHESGPLMLHGQMAGFVLYPLIPWTGVICLGYAFGPVVLFDPVRRQRVSAVLGLCFVAVFTVLRVFHLYGDAEAFEHLQTPGQTLMSFLDVSKYPPSLHYLLATLGVLLLLYAAFDVAVTRNWAAWLRHFIETYGRVPFFYYVLHLYLLHGAALLLALAEHRDWRFWLIPGAVFFKHLSGWGFNLAGVYAIWAMAVLVLYLPCLWFSRVKARRRDWWLSYL